MSNTVRQYVGARYVPKFYENSQNALLPTWEANTAYEALTIVTYNNSSYTSKIPVPASIGNPAQNPAYWANTGDYNAQVEAYREETVTIQENLNKTNQNLAIETQAREQADTEIHKQIDKYYLFIGDSYAVETVTGQNRWPVTLANLLKLNNNQYTISAQGSTGFVGTTANTWETLLENANVPDKEAVTDIVVAGGTNDANLGSTEQLLPAMESFMSKANELYPNARVYLADIMYASNITLRNHAFDFVDRYYSQFINYGGIYLPNTNKCILDTSLLKDDGIHPIYNGTANNMIAQAIYNALNGTFYRFMSRELTFTPTDDIDSVEGLTVYEYVYNELMGWQFLGTTTTIPNTFNITFKEEKNIAKMIQIGTINTMLPTPGGNIICTPCAVVPRTTAPTNIAIQAKLIVSRAGVYLELDPQSTASAFTPAINVTNINIRPYHSVELIF